MPDADGVPNAISYSHPGLALGRRPADTSRPVLRMASHLRASVYERPPAVDYAHAVDSWILGANFQYGTCGPVSVANLALLVSTVLGDTPLRFTNEEIFDLYRRSGNPRFNPDTGEDDNGVIMSVMLSELVSGGIGFGPRNVKALAYGALDGLATEEMWAAASLFGGVLVGADLDHAQAQQFERGTTWDVAAGSPPWGGHAMLGAPRYADQPGTAADRTALVTWAKLTEASSEFFARQVPEIYAVIFPWHVRDRGFRAGVDLAGVAAEYEDLTGRRFPRLPAPGPAPELQPTPMTELADFPFDELDAWARRPRAWKQSRRAAELYATWKRNHGLT